MGNALIDWCRSQPERKGQRGEDTRWNQVFFIRDTLPTIWSNSLEEYKTFVEGPNARVVGMHHSKSIDLVVFGVNHPRLGFRAVLRNNLYNWNVTLDSDRDIIINPKLLFDSESTSYCFFEGFPKDWCIEVPYKKNKRRFAFSCGGDYDLYAIFWQIVLALDPTL